MTRPHAFFHGRQRRPALALLVGLLSLLSGAPALAQPPADPPVPAAEPAQSAVRLFLPLLTNPGAPTAPGAPVIEAFQPSSTAGPMVAEVELRWRVRGATSLRVEPGVGDVSAAASASVYPVATTTYTLTATNDKGSVTATATYSVDALPVPNPLTIAARFDAGRTAAANIGPAGGSVTATGADGTRYTLSVPPEALTYTEAITLTPVAAIDAMPFATTGVHAVSIVPEGLLFIEPATLTITPPTLPPGPQVGFAFEGAGANFHLRRPEASGALPVIVAQSYGVVSRPSLNELNALARAFPSDSMDAVEHLMASMVAKLAGPAGKLEVQQSDPNLDLLAPLVPSYEFSRKQLSEAITNPDILEEAVEDYIWWRTAIKSNEEPWRAQITELNLLLGEALRKAGELASERCNQSRPAQGFALQRYIAYAKRFGLANTRAALEERLRKCWVFAVTFQSRMDQTSEGVAALYELRSEVQLIYQPGSGIVGAAPLTWQRFDIGPLDPGCVRGGTVYEGSTFLAEGAGLGLKLAPVSRTSPNVSFELSYEVGEPMVQWTVTCPDQPTVPFSSPLWWVMYSEFHRDERQGQLFTARAANVNPNGFPGWIYTNTLPGGALGERTEIALRHTPTR